MNVIGDIAGNYLTLQALLKQMPDEEPVSLGDMVDRGPRSFEVVDFFMKNGKAVLGNHEDMMLDFYDREYNDDSGYSSKYELGTWLWNGGSYTRKQYLTSDLETLNKHLTWIRSLPKGILYNEFILTHAPLSAHDEDDEEFIWNRFVTFNDENKINVYGHNSSFKVHYRDGRIDSNQIDVVDNSIQSICLDNSSRKMLVGLNLNNKKLYYQEVID